MARPERTIFRNIPHLGLGVEDLSRSLGDQLGETSFLQQPLEELRWNLVGYQGFRLHRHKPNEVFPSSCEHNSAIRPRSGGTRLWGWSKAYSHTSVLAHFAPTFGKILSFHL